MRSDERGRPDMSRPTAPVPAAEKWVADDMERLRHKNQKLNLSLGAEIEKSFEKTQQKATSQRRELVLQAVWQQASEQDARARIIQKDGIPIGPRTITSARAKVGPRDASAPLPPEIASRFQPVAKAIALAQKEAQEAEDAQRKAQNATTLAYQANKQIEAGDRSSKHMELVTQSQNLARRQQLIDAQKQEAATRTTKQQQSETAARHAARKASEALQKKIAEQRAKVEKARREAWHVQAHWQSPAGVGSARWNEPRADKAHKARTLGRTAAALSPAPPAVPSPRGVASPRGLPIWSTRTPPGTAPSTPAH